MQGEYNLNIKIPEGPGENISIQTFFSEEKEAVSLIWSCNSYSCVLDTEKLIFFLEFFSSNMAQLRSY